ncbi:MAG: hypothetical protein RIB59_06670, partial [Rhodospirillales bacterium]
PISAPAALTVSIKFGSILPYGIPGGRAVTDNEGSVTGSRLRDGPFFDYSGVGAAHGGSWGKLSGRDKGGIDAFQNM